MSESGKGLCDQGCFFVKKLNYPYITANRTHGKPLVN